MKPANFTAPSLLRRFAALGYDSLLLLALWFLSSLPWVWFAGTALTPAGGLWHRAYQLWLVLVALAFFAGFWRHGGQTLGMRAWRIRIVTHAGAPVGLPAAVKRFLWGLLSLLTLGSSWWWSLIDRERLGWHERLSGTRLILVPGRASANTPQQQDRRAKKQE